MKRGTATIWGSHVYALSNSDGHIKIGVAYCVVSRAKQLAGKLKRPIEIVGLSDEMRRRDAFRIEKALHAEFADRRIYGEWFNIRPADWQAKLDQNKANKKRAAKAAK